MNLGLAIASLTLLAACAGSPREAVERGDLLYGTGSVDAAIAEYKLALRQRGEEPELLLRLGAAYGSRGDVEAGLRYLSRLLTLDSAYRFQVAAELSDAARVARDKGAPDNMARALEPVQRLGIGLVPPDLRLPLARYYTELSDPGRALPLYLAAAESDSVPLSLQLETARAFQELGGCRQALGYFEGYLDLRGTDAASRTGARWQYGTCLFEVAEQEHDAGNPNGARSYLDRLIAQGVPRTVLDRARFLRGEILFDQGREDAAAEDFRAVLELNPARSGPLVQAAEERLRQIRYGYR